MDKNILKDTCTKTVVVQPTIWYSETEILQQKIPSGTRIRKLSSKSDRAQIGRSEFFVYTKFTHGNTTLVLIIYQQYTKLQG